MASVRSPPARDVDDSRLICSWSAVWKKKKWHESGEGSFSFLFKFGGFLGRGVFVDMRFEMIWRED